MPALLRSKVTCANQIINLNGNGHIKCVFYEFHMIFSADAPVSLVRRKMTRCAWGISGAAALTVDFVKALHGKGWHGRRMIEETFDLIRGKPDPRCRPENTPGAPWVQLGFYFSKGSPQIVSRALPFVDSLQRCPLVPPEQFAGFIVSDRCGVVSSLGDVHHTFAQCLHRGGVSFREFLERVFARPFRHAAQ
jgi:hypothetical protein